MIIISPQVSARKILLAFLGFTIILSIVAIFVRYSISQNLKQLSALTGKIVTDQSEPEKVLFLLNDLEGDFQKSLLNMPGYKSSNCEINNI